MYICTHENICAVFIFKSPFNSWPQIAVPLLEVKTTKENRH